MKVLQKKWYDLDQLKGVRKLLLNKVLPFVRDGKIDIYTGAYEKGVLYHANPCFKDSQWQDWAYVDWGEDYGVCPVHLLAFIDLRSLTKDIDIQGTIIEKVFFVAIVHMIEKPLETKSSNQKDRGSDFAAHANSWLFYKSSKMQSKEDDTVVSLVHVESIVGPCIGIPLSSVANNKNNDFLFLKRRDDWSSTLVDLMKISNEMKYVV